MTTPSDDYRLIPLTQGQFAKVDASDFEWLSQWKWYAWWSAKNRTFYAMRKPNPGRAVYMHREILGLKFGDLREADHVSRETLDNTRSNLRIASRSENQCNKIRPINNKTGFKGVSLEKKNGLYRADIIKDKKHRFLGFCKTAEEAYQLYCSASTELHGEFGRTR